MYYQPKINRKIPTPSHPIKAIDLFANDFLENYPMKKTDIEMMMKIRDQLIETGVLERSVENRGKQSIESLNEMIEESKKLAKSEKELNSEYYDPSVESVFGEDLSLEEDWENPSLDGIDDYGNQVYNNHREY